MIGFARTSVRQASRLQVRHFGSRFDSLRGAFAVNTATVRDLLPPASAQPLVLCRANEPLVGVLKQMAEMNARTAMVVDGGAHPAGVLKAARALQRVADANADVPVADVVRCCSRFLTRFAWFWLFCYIVCWCWCRGVVVARGTVLWAAQEQHKEMPEKKILFCQPAVSFVGRCLCACNSFPFLPFLLLFVCLFAFYFFRFFFPALFLGFNNQLFFDLVFGDSAFVSGLLFLFPVQLFLLPNIYTIIITIKF